MFEKKLPDTVTTVRLNLAARIRKICSLPVSTSYKSVFILQTEERNLNLDTETLKMMKIIGTTGSSVCLHFLSTSKRNSALKIAYHLSTQLQTDNFRFKAIISTKGVVTERKILLSILDCKRREKNV